MFQLAAARLPLLMGPAALVSDLHQIPPAAGLIRLPCDEAVSLQGLQHPGHRRRVHLVVCGQLPLVAGSFGGQIGQQLRLAGAQAQRSQVLAQVVALGVNSSATIMRTTRSSMLEVMRQDYIRTARAKGLSEKKVIYKHAFRNTLIPLVTIIGGSLPGLFSGALITETLFSIPGIGYVSYQSMVAGDIPFSMFYLSFMAVLTLASNLLTDILYGVVDPRVRIS